MKVRVGCKFFEEHHDGSELPHGVQRVLDIALPPFNGDLRHVAPIGGRVRMSGGFREGVQVAICVATGGANMAGNCNPKFHPISFGAL